MKKSNTERTVTGGAVNNGYPGLTEPAFTQTADDGGSAPPAGREVSTRKYTLRMDAGNNHPSTSARTIAPNTTCGATSAEWSLIVLTLAHGISRVHNRTMRFAGVLPEDAPDPRIEQAQRLKLMPVPVIGLAPQPGLEDIDTVGTEFTEDSAGNIRRMSVSVTHTLWRNPADRSDPADRVETLRSNT